MSKKLLPCHNDRTLKYLDLDYVSFHVSTEKKGGVRYDKYRVMTPETLA